MGMSQEAAIARAHEVVPAASVFQPLEVRGTTEVLRVYVASSPSLALTFESARLTVLEIAGNTAKTLFNSAGMTTQAFARSFMESYGVPNFSPGADGRSLIHLFKEDQVLVEIGVYQDVTIRRIAAPPQRNFD